MQLNFNPIDQRFRFNRDTTVNAEAENGTKWEIKFKSGDVYRCDDIHWVEEGTENYFVDVGWNDNHYLVQLTIPKNAVEIVSTHS